MVYLSMKSVSVMLCVFVIGMTMVDAIGELTPSNWDELTWGKFIFVAMQVPKCHHCVKMKPAWNKLAEKYEGHEDIFVGSVDCMNEATRILCQRNFVTGFPQMLYGSPHKVLTKYVGDRAFESFDAFLAANATKACSVKHIGLCDATEKAEIERLQALAPADLLAETEAEHAKFQGTEDEYKKASDPVYAGYTEGWGAAEKLSKVTLSNPDATEEQKKAAKDTLANTTKYLQRGVRAKIEEPNTARQESYEKAYAGHLGLMKSVEVASKRAAAVADDTAADATQADAGSPTAEAAAAADTKDDL